MAVPRPRRTPRGTSAVQSVMRATRVDRSLAARRIGQRGELASLHGVHRSTTLRLLQTLEHFGYVSRGQARGEFRLGLRLYALGLAVSEQNELLAAARPIMRDLAESTGETIDLTLCDQGDMILLESSPAGLARSDRSRARMASPGTTAGKLYLASLPPYDVERLVTGAWSRGSAPKSITDLAALSGRARAGAHDGLCGQRRGNRRGSPLCRGTHQSAGACRRTSPALGAPRHRLFARPIAVSLQMVFAAIVGGLYVSLGPTVGAIITIMLAEVLRIGFGTKAVGWDNLVYGVLLVVFIIFLPKGILGSVLDRLKTQLKAPPGRNEQKILTTCLRMS